jgi:tryptophan-rich sensory protein
LIQGERGDSWHYAKLHAGVPLTQALDPTNTGTDMSIRAIDFLFYLNYQYENSRAMGYMLVAMALLPISITALLALDSHFSGFVAYLTNIYPFDLTQNVRSMFNKRSGPAVLFCLPLCVLGCWMLFGRGRSSRLIRNFDSMNLRIAKSIVVLYSVGLILALMLAMIPFRFTNPLLGLAIQLTLLLVISRLVVHRVISRCAAI